MIESLHLFLITTFMSRICNGCGRGALTMNLRSKSMVAVKSRQHVNLQARTVDGQRVKLCTRCLRTMAAKPASVTVKAAPKRLTQRRTKQKAR